jgi:hypothetical protein
MRTKTALLVLGSGGLAACLLWPGGRFVKTDPSITAETPYSVSLAPKTAPGWVRADTEAALDEAEFKFDWRQMETSDLKLLVTRLRGAAFPEETTRDIILGRVNRRYAPRMAALRRATASHYWQCWQRRSSAEEQRRSKQEQALKELQRERDALVFSLLGIEYEDYAAGIAVRPDPATALVEDLNLRESVRPQASQLLRQYDAWEREVSERAGGTLGLAEQTELDQLYARKIEELKRLLTPRELEDFELRASPLALRLRSTDLIGFSPTEEEFRGVFRVLNAAQKGESSAAQTEQPLEEVLGPKRFADYRRCQDFTYRGLVEFASHFGLGTESATQVHEMREAVIQQADALQHNPKVSEEMRQTALLQIQAEASKAVLNSLGDQAFTQYVDTQFGRWLRLIPSWTNGVVFRD